MNFIELFVCNFCIYFLKLESIKTWVVEDGNRLMTPTHDLDLVLHEMLAKDIGVRGSTVFTITYPLFASVRHSHSLLNNVSSVK